MSEDFVALNTRRILLAMTASTVIEEHMERALRDRKEIDQSAVCGEIGRRLITAAAEGRLPPHTLSIEGGFGGWPFFNLSITCKPLDGSAEFGTNLRVSLRNTFKFDMPGIFPPQPSDGFMEDLVLFAKGHYGKWIDHSGLSVLYTHHYARAESLKIDESNFFTIYKVIALAFEEAGFTLPHSEGTKMLWLVSKQDFDAAIGVPISYLATKYVGQVDDIAVMWTPNPVVAQKLLDSGAVTKNDEA